MKTGMSKFFAPTTNAFSPSTPLARKWLFLISSRFCFPSQNFKLLHQTRLAAKCMAVCPFLSLASNHLLFGSFGFIFSSLHFQSSSNIHTLCLYTAEGQAFHQTYLQLGSSYFSIQQGVISLHPTYIVS